MVFLPRCVMTLLEPVTVERPEEGHLSLRSHPRLQKVPDLAQDRRGHQQRAFRMPSFCLVRRAVAARLPSTGRHGCQFPLVRPHRIRNGAGKPVTGLRHPYDPIPRHTPGNHPTPRVMRGRDFRCTAEEPAIGLPFGQGPAGTLPCLR